MEHLGEYPTKVWSISSNTILVSNDCYVKANKDGHQTPSDENSSDKNIMLYVKTNKGNAKRGISPHLKIWPGDLDLWAMTLKITIFREDPSVQYQNHISWRKVQMVNFYVWMCITAH